MQREEERDQRAGTACTSGAPQNGEQQQRGQHVEQDVDQMMHPAVHAEELDIQHMGEQRDRHPVGGNHRGEGPFNAVRGQAGLDMEITRDVVLVVIVDEIEMA